MKLVLKYNDTVKLYNEPLEFKSLLDYAEREINLERESICLCFTDEDGDQIVIASDEDLSVMENLVGDKSYIKVTVTGVQKAAKGEHEIAETKEIQQGQIEVLGKEEAVKGEDQVEEIQTQTKQETTPIKSEKELKEQMQKEKKLQAQKDGEMRALSKQQKKAIMQEQKNKKRVAELEEKERKKAILQEEKAIKNKEQMEEKAIKNKLAQQEKERKKAATLKEKERKIAHQKAGKMAEVEVEKKKGANNFATFNKQMAEAISTLVDERVRALIPYVKEQVKETRPEEDFQEKIVHENFTCLICSAHPIVGIRYECPKCESFSLCQNCEGVYDHEHNLMKIKKLEEKNIQKKVQPCMKKLYDTFFAPNAIEKTKEIKEEESEKFKKYSGNLKQIFGGKNADYKQLINSNNFNFYGLVEEYCKLNNISQEEGHEKYVDLLCEKIATKFKKDKNDIKAIVEENIKSENVYTDYHEFEKKMAKLFKDQQREKKKVEQKAEEVKEQVKEAVIENIYAAEAEAEQAVKKEESKAEIVEIVEIAKEQEKIEIIEVKKCPGSHLTGQKRETYDLMVDFFGIDRAAEYPAFIESHIIQGKDNILQLWTDNVSVYQPC